MSATPPECTVFEGSTPHPVPMGEGTPEISLRLIQGSLLPWGEGQGEGWNPSYNPQPNDHHKTVSRVPA